MRGVKGLDRPGLQWGLVAGCALLIVSVVAAAMTIRRANARMSDIEAVYQRARTELDQMETELARERAAREAFSHEVTRLRAASPPGTPVPTLTLEPSTTRGATPPEDTGASRYPLLRTIPTRASTSFGISYRRMMSR